MHPFLESTIATYRRNREAGSHGAALAAADQAFALLASLDDFETLRELEVELAGDFYDDPEAKNSALNKFTALALRIMSRPSTDEKWLREVATLLTDVWTREGGMRWVP